MGSLLCCGCLFHHAFHPPFLLLLLRWRFLMASRQRIKGIRLHLLCGTWSGRLLGRSPYRLTAGFTFRLHSRSLSTKSGKIALFFFFWKKNPPNSNLNVHLTRGRCWVGLGLNWLATVLPNRRTYTAVSALSPLPTFVLTSARNHDDVIMIALPPPPKKKQKNRCG